MTSIAVVAHSGKTLGGGLGELRDVLARRGFEDPLWFEVPKSKKAPDRAREALKRGADLVLVWGGDGMVQRCVDALAGSGASIGVVPAGTANLLASNLGMPRDIEAAVAVALDGERRKLDVGVVNGERFAVMAGAGFDARMIHDADGVVKRRLGRLAYVVTGAKNLRGPRTGARIRVDGTTWFKGPLSCVLVGNVGTILAGVTAFERAEPDDGVLDVGVVTAGGAWQWLRALGRTAFGRPERSPFIRITTGRRIDVRLDQPMRYELDGGARKKTKRLRIEVEPAAVTACVPNRGSQ
jgi:diacylglycerol kinase (ATP)